MSFSFSAKDLPLSVKLSRMLVWLTGGYVVLMGLQSVVYALLPDVKISLKFGPFNVSGSELMIWGLAFIVIGAAIVVIGAQLTNLTPMSRNLAVAAEVALALFALVHSLNPLDDVVPLLLVIATLAALFWPDSQAAFSGTAAPAAPSGEPATGEGTPKTS